MHTVFNTGTIAHQFKVEKAETFARRSLELAVTHPAETGGS